MRYWCWYREEMIVSYAELKYNVYKINAANEVSTNIIVVCGV